MPERAGALPATAAPFLVARTAFSGKVEAHLCEPCQHAFFAPEPTEAQLARLYAGYRDAAYDRERIAVEPGYAATAAAFADPQSGYHRDRQAYYDFAIPELRGLEVRVVDFGGHDGRFARCAFPQAEIVVMDEAFERDGGDAAAALAQADLIFATHVFEHIPSPLPVLRRLAEGMRPGAVVFIEVPKEYGAIAGGTLAENFARLERRLASGERVEHALLTLHEHLAHFSKTSLKRLAERGRPDGAGVARHGRNAQPAGAGRG